MTKLPPRVASRIAAKTDGESKCGKQHQSIDPFNPTNAAVCRSPINAYDEIGR
jgi:hypothetical protein